MCVSGGGGGFHSYGYMISLEFLFSVPLWLVASHFDLFLT